MKIVNDSKKANLNVFKRAYTFKDDMSRGDGSSGYLEITKAGKIATLIPVIAQMASLIIFVRVITTEWPVEKRTFIAIISRCALSFFATPLLFLVDLVGTAITSCLAARHTQRFSVMGPR